ncbi:Rna polymerase-Associated Protein Ctr9 [Manis pentadactyla]|nr:Rna polymerase-Associated Protein Ctr9 [Manis pentadactyla]
MKSASGLIACRHLCYTFANTSSLLNYKRSLTNLLHQMGYHTPRRKPSISGDVNNQISTCSWKSIQTGRLSPGKLVNCSKPAGPICLMTQTSPSLKGNDGCDLRWLEVIVNALSPKRSEFGNLEQGVRRI